MNDERLRVVKESYLPVGRAEGVGEPEGRSAGRRGVGTKAHADWLTWSGVG